MTAITCWVALGAANRDPRRFDRPNELVLDRPQPRHLSFGSVPHFCLGSHLGRPEIEPILTELMAVAPLLRAAAPLSDIEFEGMPVMRRAKALPLAFEGGL